ncbi:MAG: lysophospholipid acyltransferase family protein [Bacteroidales bacterium]|nr:lysophospholipid acyltransferase family protein [Bacteroidales bacterium]
MAFLYHTFKLLAGLVARLPFPLLFFVASIFKFFLHYIIRYRRDIILLNLHNSFPEKLPKEIRKILSQYYKNLSQIMFEVIKLHSIRPEKLLERFTFTGLEPLAETLRKGQSVIITIGHCGNWEWMGTALGQVLPARGFAIVKPLSDKHFNRYMESLRHRINPDSTIPFHRTYRTLIRHKQEMVTFNVFAADQTPVKEEANYWTQFLNQDTPFYIGVEKLAKALHLAVFFIDIQRTGNGRYNGEIRQITREPEKTAEKEITEAYIRLLEEAIRRRPDNWLWSHRRWKLTRTPGN